VISAAPITIGYLGSNPPHVLGPPAIGEEGLAGARLGVLDNQSTGRFIGQDFVLQERRVSEHEDAAAIVTELAGANVQLVIADLDAAAVHRLADVARGSGLTIINIRATDDRLRNESCLPNLLHTAPSRAMLADGLAQYLVWKQWRRWFLVIGSRGEDQHYAGALRAAAKKFGAAIVVEKQWTFGTATARADTGHVTLQTEIPAFTRVADHDVLVVADGADEFGEQLIGRTTLPRPVAGTHGLVATGWSAVNDQWGATQLQSRFAKNSGRSMTAVDYAAWIAVRAVGEAAFRTRSTDPKTLVDYLQSPDFLISGFKGRGQSFRPWDGQMRQPILIAGPRLLVSVSPQPGFLHRFSELDTLGTDREESRCKR
jgi:ABC transporter substrate binding protein (PQQ-dependent alcohol dehydrogenase system)